MSKINPTEPPFDPKATAARVLQCEEWETLLTDALDGTLPAGESDAFQYHGKTCARCAEMLSQAKQGREWLQFLHSEPPAPADLMARILARTSGMAPAGATTPEVVTGTAVLSAPLPSGVPFWKRVKIPPALRRMAEPRLMMTAAMAFFSVTLTLNIAGIHLSAVHLADLKPANLGLNIDRQYHMASARVVRYYDNLRFVYELEARVRELRRNEEQDDSSSQEKQKQTQPAQPATHPDAPAANPRKSGGKSDGSGTSQPRAFVVGRAIEASLGPSRPVSALGITPEEQPSGHTSGGNGEDLKFRRAHQAERGLV